jgi:hypothetical protein
MYHHGWCLDLWKCVRTKWLASICTLVLQYYVLVVSLNCVDRAGSLTRHIGTQSKQICQLLASFCLHSLQLTSLSQD